MPSGRRAVHSRCTSRSSITPFGLGSGEYLSMRCTFCSAEVPFQVTRTPPFCPLTHSHPTSKHSARIRAGPPKKSMKQ
eukprot:1316808-Rhodomonas_salina.1